MNDGYASGPDAPIRATAQALGKIAGAATLVLVEGVSDQIAVETAARCRGYDLSAAAVVVVPIGGAHAVRGFVDRLTSPVRLAGLCDLREAGLFRRVVPEVFVCAEDLEDELIRAVGAPGVEALMAAHGDLNAFRSLQAQPAWRGHPAEAQMRRFFGSGSHRKSRYARLLVEAADPLPRPLGDLLASVS